MTRLRRIVLATTAALCLGGAPAAAERLTISISTHRVLITSNFVGTELTLFGAVEPDASSIGRAGGHALVITVIGPKQSVVTWRKERVLGLWVNTRSRTFKDVPSYLAVLTNRPTESIAAPAVLQRFRIGLNYALDRDPGVDMAELAPDERFGQALLRLKSEHGLYREQPNAVTFLTPTLFRAGIPLPSNVPVGEYAVEIKLFSGGVMIASETTAFEIIKAGFEQYLAAAAREYSLVYGLGTALLALFTGWLGSVLFRRD